MSGAHVVVRVSAGQMLARPSLTVEVGGLTAHDTEEALRVIANEVAAPLARAIGVTPLAEPQVFGLADDDKPGIDDRDVTYAIEQHDAGTELRKVGSGGLVYVALMDDDEPPGTDRVAIVCGADAASYAYAWLGAQGLPRRCGYTVRGSMYPQVAELDDFELLVRKHVGELSDPDLHIDTDEVGLHAQSDAAFGGSPLDALTPVPEDEQ